MDPEFDRYAPTYSELLRDPIRDRFASDFDYFHRRKWIAIRDYMAERKINPVSLTWLDVGCGQGELLRLGEGEFGQSLGCDPSSKMRENFSGAKVVQQDSPTEIPFDDQSVDLVTAVCVYHHVAREQRALLTSSIFRVLKPGGVFCLIEHNPWNPVTQVIVKRCPVDVNAELLSPLAVSRLLRHSGLKVIETVHLLFFPERIFERISGVEKSLRRLPFGGQFATFSRKPTA